MNDLEFPRHTRHLLMLAGTGFLAGLVVSWILSGTESGSKADWIAAFGTWVIGLAASVLAYEGNRWQRESSGREQAERAATRRKSLLLMRDLAKECPFLRDGVARDREKRSGNLGMGYFRLKFMAADAKAVGAKFDHVGIKLSDDTVHALYNVESALIQLVGSIKFFMIKYPTGREDFDETNCNETKWVIEAADKLALRGEALCAALTVELESSS